MLLKVLSCVVNSLQQKKNKSCLSATFSLLLIWVMPFSILTDKPALLLSPYSPLLLFPSFHFCILHEKKRKSSCSTSKADSFHCTFSTLLLPLPSSPGVKRRRAVRLTVCTSTWSLGFFSPPSCSNITLLLYFVENTGHQFASFPLWVFMIFARLTLFPTAQLFVTPAVDTPPPPAQLLFCHTRATPFVNVNQPFLNSTG